MAAENLSKSRTELMTLSVVFVCVARLVLRNKIATQY